MRSHACYKKQKTDPETQGIEVTMRILCEIGLIELEEYGRVDDTSLIIFQVF